MMKVVLVGICFEVVLRWADPAKRIHLEDVDVDLCVVFLADEVVQDDCVRAQIVAVLLWMPLIWMLIWPMRLLVTCALHRLLLDSCF